MLLDSQSHSTKFVSYLFCSFNVFVLSIGPDDHTKFIMASDDDAGDGKNAKIVCRLMPDRDYFIQIQTFHPEGGKFEFSVTSW